MMNADCVRFHWVGPVSDDELLELNEINSPLNFERAADGELIVTPPAGGHSSRRNGVLTARLYNWNETENRGVVFDSSGGFRLPDTSVFAPDASWVRVEKWAALRPEDQERFPPLVPDLVFELISPSDTHREAREKIDAFRKNGVAIAVLIDPYEKWIELDGERKPWQPIELALPGCREPFVLDPAVLE
jgi:Uma2 family endonuclease